MTKTSFTPYLKKKFPKDNHGILNIRITRDRKSNYISLGESIKEKHWNAKKKEVRISHAESERLNLIISSRVEELKKEYGFSEPIKRKSHSFISYLLDEIDRLEKRNNYGTRKRYKTTYYHLVKFLKGKDLLFSQIDVDFVTNFETYLFGLVKENTGKNYINCIKKLYNQRVRTSSLSPQISPFTMYVNRRKPVEKKFLDQRDVELIMKKDFNRDNVLYDVKNYFLFQIFCQGMRVRDLMTIKYGNIEEGRLHYTQTKTRKPHKAHLTDRLVFLIKDYLDDEVTSIALNHKFEWAIEGETRMLTYDQIKNDYTEFLNRNAHKAIILLDVKIMDKAEKAKKKLIEIRFQVNLMIQSRLKLYAKLHANEFIFPILQNEDFKDVVFDTNYKLTQYQYNQLEAKASLYNKRLKRLQVACNISKNITSHLARHTYTNLMLQNDADVYEISKSLGHQRLSTTENYLPDFDQPKIDSSNTDMDNQFPIL